METEKLKRMNAAIKEFVKCSAAKEKKFFFLPGEYYNEIDLKFILEEYNSNELLEKIEFLEREEVLKKVILLRNKKRLDFSEKLLKEELNLIGRVLKLGDISFSDYYCECEYWEVLKDFEIDLK
ncbi:hypothetical protein FV113G1_22390 [Fusobacterium varium]|nr:hypothetical protein FV113G1_22390 [Fusobacterium varium]